MSLPIQRRKVPSDVYSRLVADGVPEIMARIYAARGVTQASQMSMDLSRLLPITLRGIPESVDRILQAMKDGERICAVADYDTDGASAAALMVSTLREWGADIHYLLPNRFTQGYGLSPELADLAAKAGTHLLITVDNGIAAISGVARARALDMDVIVTDHHLPGHFLPETPYIINPNQPGCPFPSKALCGVGVAFYLVSALWRALVLNGQTSLQDSVPLRIFDLAALGTVADVVPLDANNRRIVSAGLAQIRKGKARPGIQALLEVAGIPDHQVSERDLGFALGPRLNAAGRLEDMHIGVELLLAKTIDDALPYAQRLDSLNRERRQIENDRLQAAMARLQSEQDYTRSPVIVVHDPEGHEGVVGLVAGRLRELYNRPTVVFAPGEQPGVLKGSARSVPGVHIRDLLAQVDAEHPTLIDRFGGHAMAAGLTLSVNRLENFRATLQRVAASTIAPEALLPYSETDGELPEAGFSLDFVRTILELGPWGQAFPVPSFDNRFRVLESRRVGADKQTLRLKVQPLFSGASAACVPITAIRFRCGSSTDPKLGDVIHLHYQLQINWYKGVDSLQLLILDWAPSQEP